MDSFPDYGNLILKVKELSERQGSPAKLLDGFAELIKTELHFEEVISKPYNERTRTASEDMVYNTMRYYVDNRLSDYSSFPELINYFRSGFKSCLILPVILDSKPFGTVTMLSKREYVFEDRQMLWITYLKELMEYMVAFRAEKEKSFAAARYFDAAFDSFVPQAVFNSEGKVLKANKSFLNIFGISPAEASKINLRSEFGITGEIQFGKMTDVLYKGYKLRLLLSQVNSSANLCVVDNLTEIAELKERLDFLESLPEQHYLILDRSLKVTWCGGGDAGLFLGKAFTESIVSGKEEFLEKIAAEKGDVTLELDFGNRITKRFQCVFYRFEDRYHIVLRRDFSGYLNSVKAGLDTLTRLSSDAIFRIDTNGYIDFFNKGSEALFGYRNQEIVGKPFSVICADIESQNKISNSLSIAKANRSPITDVLVSMVAKGMDEPIPCYQSITPERDENGEVCGYYIINKELRTKRQMQQLEDALDKSNKELKNYKSELELQTQFIYNISHDLKTPITAVYGFMKLMVDGEFGKLTDEQNDILNTMMGDLNRLMDLIMQVLDVAKFSANKIRLDYQQVNLEELGQHPSIRSLSELCSRKGVSFGWHVDYNVPSVSADPNRLIQVFVNLITNAIKFTEKGSVEVYITKVGRSVRVDVKDTGIGISKDDIGKIFKKFYQLQRRGLTKQEGSGTGLGLTIVKEIVNLHGGKMHVKSEVGVGSDFWFTIPISEKEKKKGKNG